MAIKLSQAQSKVVAMAIRAALSGADVGPLTATQMRSLRIAYEKIQNDAATRRMRGTSKMLSAQEAEDMLAKAAERQGVWLNWLNP
jgi:hypothetical protein